jgi:hypothetical protein
MSPLKYFISEKRALKIVAHFVSQQICAAVLGHQLFDAQNSVFVKTKE